MPEIDETSETLGYLKANMAVLLDGQRQINDKLTLMNGSVGKAHRRIDDLESGVEDWRATKKRAVLGLIGLGGMAGAGGSGIFKILSVFWNGN